MRLPKKKKTDDVLPNWSINAYTLPDHPELGVLVGIAFDKDLPANTAVMLTVPQARYYADQVHVIADRAMNENDKENKS